jgi:hypothetical protein
MQTATYPASKIGTKLVAAALALAGSAVTVGGNLVIAGSYAANAGVAQSTMVAHDGMPRQVAVSKCANNAS